MRRIERRAAVLAALSLSLGMAACDLGPNGPATVTGRIEGHPALGAVVLEVTWRGVTAFAGRGSTQAYAAPSTTVPDRHRVVLIGPDISELPFEIEVESAFAETPVITVVEAVNVGNLPVDASTLRVELEW
jgi:hypothetical protein